MTIKQTIATIWIALVGLITIGSASAQSLPQLAVPLEPQQVQAEARPSAQTFRPADQPRDAWYQFLVRQFNPNNLDYGAWMEERRQALLNESGRNPYFKYSAAVTLTLLLMIVVCVKQWFDYRRTLWITAEMMADLYNHDLYSRNAAEMAIRRYNDHIERCNRLVEAGRDGTALPVADSGECLCRAPELNHFANKGDDCAQLNARRTKLSAREQTQTGSSRGINYRADESYARLVAETPGERSTNDPYVPGHVNRLQEQMALAFADADGAEPMVREGLARKE